MPRPDKVPHTNSHNSAGLGALGHAMEAEPWRDPFAPSGVVRFRPDPYFIA